MTSFMGCPSRFCRLGADQDDAEDQEGCPGQPSQARWVLRDAEQAEVVERQRTEHRANDNQSEHCRRAEARHRKDRNRTEDPARST